MQLRCVITLFPKPFAPTASLHQPESLEKVSKFIHKVWQWGKPPKYHYGWNSDPHEVNGKNLIGFTGARISSCVFRIANFGRTLFLKLFEFKHELPVKFDLLLIMYLFFSFKTNLKRKQSVRTYIQYQGTCSFDAHQFYLQLHSHISLNLTTSHL